MDKTTPKANPQPFSVRWFSPWKWKARTYAEIALVMLFAYVLSPGLAQYLSTDTSLVKRDRFNLRGWMRDFVGPAKGLGKLVPLLGKVHHEEYLLLRETFGSVD